MPDISERTTIFPESDIAPISDARELNDADWNELANDAWNAVNTSFTAREGGFNKNLKAWYALYENEVRPKDMPWVGCSNVSVPLIAAKTEALRDQVAAITFVPEFYIVTGLTEEAAQQAHLVQTFYNNEFRKQRGRTTWYAEHLNWLHLSLRDGTAVMEVLWKKKSRQATFGIAAPVLVEGLPQFDDDGNIKTEVQDVPQEVIDYDDVSLRPVPIKDFMLIPDEALSIEDAVGVVRTEWQYESDLMAMVEEGLLNKDWVERALTYVPQGGSDVVSDPQGYYDKTAGGQINVGQGQGPMVSKFFKNRGPLQVDRIHTRQFRVGKGEGVQDLVIWSHRLSHFMLGWVPEQYLSPTRPFFSFCPFPRPDSFYGFSLPERQAPLVAQINANKNQRNDAIDMKLGAPLLINRAEEIWDKGMTWGINKSWAVNDVNTAAKRMEIGDVPIASYQEEAADANYLDQITGLNQPMTGGMSSGRRSASEVKIASSSAGVRANAIGMLFRLSARSVLEFVNSLKMRYMSDPKPGMMQVTREMLGMPLKMDVSGSGDPLDKQAFADEVLSAYNLMSQSPDVQQDAVHRYNLNRMVLEAIGIPNIESILGSAQDAEQKKQAEQEAAQMQQQMAMQQAQGGQPGGPPGGQPPQGGPPQGGPPPGPPHG